MDDDTSKTPDSLLPYDEWMEDSLRFVVLRALSHVAEHGLPGGHHFYITFRTDFPGVVMPARLKEKYKQEMTIVLQHQFDKLRIDGNDGFSVTLSFGGIASTLDVPVQAISAFVDPSIQYGLRFRVRVPETPQAAEPAPEPPPAPHPGQDEAGAVPQVVSLDAFRKRRD
jgi:hypothetical protein